MKLIVVLLMFMHTFHLHSRSAWIHFLFFLIVHCLFLLVNEPANYRNQLCIVPDLQGALVRHDTKLQALVYDILPPTTAIVDYTKNK